jgi:hypothetical protein
MQPMCRDSLRALLACRRVMKLVAVVLAVAVQIGFAFAVTPLGNPGLSRQTSYPYPADQPRGQLFGWLCLAVALATFVFVAYVVVRAGDSRHEAAGLAALVPAPAFFGAGVLEQAVFPELPYVLVPPGLWLPWYIWLVGIALMPVVSGGAALTAFMAAIVLRRIWFKAGATPESG